ncbi:MAG: DMT family transporter [Pseudomonadota bacterium]
MFSSSPPLAALKRRWLALGGNRRGILLILCDNVLVSAMFVLVKVLGGRYDAFEIAFFRSVIGLAVLVPLLVRFGPIAFRTRRLPMHVMRGVFSVGGLVTGYYTLIELPLADATAISFARPLIMTVLAVLFLAEIVRWRRWSAVAVGFVGVLVMVRPGLAGFHPAMVVGLASAALACGSAVAVKKLTETETTAALMFYSAVSMLVFTAPPAALVWRTPPAADLGSLLVIGLLGAAGQFCFVRAYVEGSAAVLAPFDYSRLIFATALGLALFGELPGPWTLIGAGIIVASTLYITRREARLDRLAPPRGPAPG